MIKKDKIISIGLKIESHNTGVGLCIYENRKTYIYNIQEERFNREKNTSKFPHQAIKQAEKIAGITSIFDADVIVCEKSTNYAEYPKELLDNFCQSEKTLKKIQYVSHHLCHASNVFFFSGHDKSIVIVMDGRGSFQSEIVSNSDCMQKYYEGISIFTASKTNFDLRLEHCIDTSSKNSVGPKNVDIVYHIARNACGFGQFGAGKIMGLASYAGKHKGFKYFDKELIHYDGINADYGEMYENSKIYKEQNERFCIKNVGQDIEGVQLAYEAQKILEDYYIYISRKIKGYYPQYTNLCIGGGNGLNLSANRAVLDSNLFDDVFITPSSDDSGIALGASIYGMYNILNHEMPIDRLNASYLGIDYYDELLPENIKNEGNFLNDDELLQKLIKDLLDDKIIGICRGRSENGPRALGNRSIICNPYKISMKDKVNDYVKQREHWRPFSPMVLREYLPKYFDIDKESRYMLFTFYANKEFGDKCPAVVHCDHTCRVQTVTEEDNDFIYKLLKELEKLGLPPVVLNTSFNRNNEPIVESPYDAYVCYKESKLESLIIGNYYFTRGV